MLRLSKGGRAHGMIKSMPGDFRVEEITAGGVVLEIGKKYSPEMLGIGAQADGKFSIFVMQKTGWNTSQALKAIARKFRRGIKSTAFAGTKDRTSVSTQLCSIFGVRPEQISSVHIKDISINGAWYSNSKIEMGDLMGNRFGILARDARDCSGMEGIISELHGTFPNYFGEQRFGNRGANVDIGVAILKGDFEGAAMSFLTETQNETNEDAMESRKRLAEERDFKDAIRYFPQYLKYERLMIEYLSRYPNNYANAIRKLPRSISLMLVHSVEAYIFNRVLEERIANGTSKPESKDLVCKANEFGFPDLKEVTPYDKDRNAQFAVGNIIGYDTKSVTETEQRLLDELGIGIESFKVNGLNELNSRGTYRVMFAPYKDIGYVCRDDTMEMRFSLPAGSYATVLLEEFLDYGSPG
ncbi:MAG: tRNA pseudouridine(13) synthase TruD [Candidatus Micrarchaeota archaeon]|nr:tRNA pseudouridine(13) synthase TruD [Candidatus Micrarchaeota archaeon]